ncbi:MarR family transcriptional regulator [bacterium 1xD8-48]|nr:MarR family transcriptional regulator [bacterium 1xD8-48]
METERYVTMMEDVYRFVMYASDDYNTPHDYGTGSILNRVEMHTLVMIAAAPGICITDVARMWNRTLGAASKNVNRLCSKGYVEKRKLPGNDKTIHLHPTPEGEKLAKLHRQFDLEQGTAALNHLLKAHTAKELETFHRVLLSCVDIYAKKPGKTAQAGPVKQ